MGRRHATHKRKKSKGSPSSTPSSSHSSSPTSSSPLRESATISTKEFISHDHKQLQEILGPESEDLDFLEDTLSWPLKPETELDAEWNKLCDEYTKLTGSRKNNDGTEIPSICDACHYIGDWALKYADMGNSIPTPTGSPPLYAPYWARNQVILYADNGKICPPQFKQELEDEMFYLLHLANKDDESHSDCEDGRVSDKNIALEKVELLVRFFFFASRAEIPQMFEHISEEYEVRLRRGMMGEHKSPFCDLFCNMVFASNGDFLKSPRSNIDKVKQFVVECEKRKGREFSWGPRHSDFQSKLPHTDRTSNFLSGRSKRRMIHDFDRITYLKIMSVFGLLVGLYIIAIVKWSW